MTKLKDLEVEEISLVDNPANEEAKIIMTKRAAPVFDEATALLERLTKKLGEQLEKAADAELLKQAQKYELLGENPAELAGIFKKIKAADKSAYEALIEKFDAVLAVQEKTFAELGKSGEAPVTNDLERLAAQIQKKEPALTRRQAIDKAWCQLEAI